MKTQLKVGILIAALVALVWIPSAGAALITLSNNNSTVNINPDSQQGVYNWVVDGQDMLFQQWFWYRTGDGAEHSIDTLSAPTVETFLGTRGVDILYSGNGLTIEVVYVLAGGSNGSTRSDLDEQIIITNTSNTAQDLHFFQYSDFDLCDIGGDTVNVANGNQVRQSDGTCSLSETVVTPAASFWQAAAYSTTLSSLNDGSATTLNGVSSFGPGDATWAYEWNTTLGAGDRFVISKDKSIQPIPEPATLTLIGLGAGLAGLSRKRRKA